MSDEQLAADIARADPGRPGTFAQTLGPFWESLGLEGEPPQVEIDRVVSVDEANVVFYECMEEQGFPSHVDEWGQRGIEFPRDQEDAMKLAQYTCYARYPLEDKYLQPYSLDQLRAIYDWNVNEMSTCLREQGIEPSAPPTFEAFVARYAQTGREHWSASEGLELPPLDPECPDSPPDSELYP